MLMKIYQQHNKRKKEGRPLYTSKVFKGTRYLLRGGKVGGEKKREEKSRRNARTQKKRCKLLWKKEA